MTPAELLAATAADMRAVADAVPVSQTWHRWVATENWVYGPPGNGIRVGWDIREHSAAATHIAAWDPDMARAVASWLEAKAAKYGRLHPEEQARRADAGEGTLPPMLETCAAWWKSRGREPVAP